MLYFIKYKGKVQVKVGKFLMDLIIIKLFKIICKKLVKLVKYYDMETYIFLLQYLVETILIFLEQDNSISNKKAAKFEHFAALKKIDYIHPPSNLIT